MTSRPQLLVFSDLDGTLLDHDSYDWSPARPALAALAARKCPVVLTSSKTAAEMIELQGAMDLTSYPAIVENGAGVIGAPGASDRAFDYDGLREALDSLPRATRDCFRGFGDMSVDEVANVTGLSPEGAVKAKDRQFSEPGTWTGTDAARDAFVEDLKTLGVTAQQGGRFLTISYGRTKADGMTDVTNALMPEQTLALGDAPNDIPMLEMADHGVIIANPHRPPLPTLEGEASGRIIRTQDPGPAGWNAAVLAHLAKLEHKTGADAHG